MGNTARLRDTTVCTDATAVRNPAASWLSFSRPLTARGCVCVQEGRDVQYCAHGVAVAITYSWFAQLTDDMLPGGNPLVRICPLPHQSKYSRQHSCQAQGIGSINVKCILVGSPFFQASFWQIRMPCLRWQTLEE